jgi:hypothetical protein
MTASVQVFTRSIEDLLSKIKKQSLTVVMNNLKQIKIEL